MKVTRSPTGTARSRPLRGFTLIELLVVVAIISLLVTILMPSLDRARFLTRMTICQSNFRTWGIAALTYAMDNGLYLPRFDIPWSTGNNCWDVPREFPIAMGRRGIGWELWFCAARPDDVPSLPAGQAYSDQSIVDALTGSPAFVRFPLCWWVPRKAAGNVFPTAAYGPWAVRVHDDGVGTIPLLTEKLYSLTSDDPRDALNGHRQNDVLESGSVLFGDGHVELRGLGLMGMYYRSWQGRRHFY